MTDSGNRRQAAKAIWRWQDPVATHGTDSRALRIHGTLRAVIALAVACLFWFTGHRGMACVVAAIGTITWLTALLSPHKLYASLTRALDTFGRWVGIAITWVFLVPIYFLLITPFGLLMRHGSRDPLRRTWSAATPTFWTDRSTTDDTPERRKRPF